MVSAVSCGGHHVNLNLVKRGKQDEKARQLGEYQKHHSLRI